MSMPQAGNGNISYAPPTKVNIYSDTQRGIQVDEGEQYRYQFFHACWL
jgi:hypothetical protein